jgi:4-carboxymuconolactone decarboxylase
MSANENERFRRGWQRLLEVDAEGGERVIESLQNVAPDLGRYVVEFAYGDICMRP